MDGFFSSMIMTFSKLLSCFKEFNHSDVSSYRISECPRLLKLSPFISQLRSPCALIQYEMAEREAKEMAPEREKKKKKLHSNIEVTWTPVKHSTTPNTHTLYTC